MLRFQLERRRVDVIANRTEEHSLSPLWNAAVGSVDEEQLRPIPNISKSLHHEFRIALGVAEDHALDVLGNRDSRLQPSDEVEVVEEQVGQDLLRLSFAEVLVFTPRFFSASRHAERRARRRAVEDVERVQFARQVHREQITNRAEVVVLRVEVPLVVPCHLGIDVVGCDYVAPGELIAHRRAAATSERRHNGDAVLRHRC